MCQLKEIYLKNIVFINLLFYVNNVVIKLNKLLFAKFLWNSWFGDGLVQLMKIQKKNGFIG